MGKMAARKGDHIVSASPGDVHIVLVPSPVGAPVPTPTPHPCTSIIVVHSGRELTNYLDDCCRHIDQGSTHIRVQFSFSRAAVSPNKLFATTFSLSFLGLYTAFRTIIVRS